MSCDRCGREPEADLTRYATYEEGEEVGSLLLCPECSYGMNRMMAAYVARREPEPPAGS